ncbi:hypothetical protein CCAND95_320004 [Capnocytophaga canis]|nr:hypothetical protein CCAND95_320004 [Capnocytophaga canis]
MVNQICYKENVFFNWKKAIRINFCALITDTVDQTLITTSVVYINFFLYFCDRLKGVLRLRLRLYP